MSAGQYGTRTCMPALVCFQFQLNAWQWAHLDVTVHWGRHDCCITYTTSISLPPGTSCTLRHRGTLAYKTLREGAQRASRRHQARATVAGIARSCCWCESTIPREATTTLYFPQQLATTFRHRENGLRKLRLVFPSLSFGFHCRQSKTLPELTLGSWLHQSARVESSS